MKRFIGNIRSGGQSGVDRAALDAARKHDITIRGWVPRNGWAEDMTESPGVLSLYPELMETDEKDVSVRTIRNVSDSSCTLVLLPGDSNSEVSNGTNLTIDSCIELNKPFLVVYLDNDSLLNISAIRTWLVELSDTEDIDLNIAGPRESESLGIYSSTLALLDILLSIDVDSPS